MHYLQSHKNIFRLVCFVETCCKNSFLENIQYTVFQDSIILLVGTDAAYVVFFLAQKQKQ